MNAIKKRRAGVADRILGTALVLACSAQLTQSAPAAPQPVVVPVMQKDLPDVPGKEMLMLTVDYPPGAVESIHRHDASAFDVHTVGRNTSTTKPAKFVVVLLKKRGVDAVLPAE
jgi:hypothetical protein